uniref:Uncharacterized protein MANES_03G160600 n=1 Tax=Rhizophora mucronata TaxID=61149 RepID=A0A2P2IL05_RHIMU
MAISLKILTEFIFSQSGRQPPNKYLLSPDISTDSSISRSIRVSNSGIGLLFLP